MYKGQRVIMQGVDIFDFIRFIHQKNKKYQATLLSQVEEVMGKDTEEYKIVRKYILDSLNNYTRSVIRSIFGDVDV